MGTNKTSKHLHKLKKVKFKNGEAVFICVNDCKFKIAVPLSLGKIVECNRCGKQFQMNEYSIRLTKPHCTDCTLTKREIRVEDVIKVMPEKKNESKADNLLEDLVSRLSSAIKGPRATEESVSEDESDLL